MAHFDDSDAVEEFELAFARLDWVREAPCLDLPSQREALAWHMACCDAALCAMDNRGAIDDRGRQPEPPHDAPLPV